MEKKQLDKKLIWRVLVVLFLSYIMCTIDRMNLSFAKIQMAESIPSLTDKVFGLAAGIFFISYVLFEIPSNLLFPKIGARRTFSRIMVLWGLTTVAMMFVQGPTSFYVLRILLGIFEAGFAPGMVFYLTYWYSNQDLGKATAATMSAGAISGVIGGPIAGWIIAHFDTHASLMGWQWMFLIEGGITVILGVCVYFLLADHPEQAKWLTQKEKAYLASYSAFATEKNKVKGQFLSVLKDFRVYLMSYSYFCVIACLYIINFWLPTMLKEAGIQDIQTIGKLTSIPWLIAIVCMFLAAKSSDYFKERRFHSGLLMLLGTLVLISSCFLPHSIHTIMITMSIATALMMASYTVFWTIPSEYFAGNTAAGAIALINSIGLMGGFASPTIMGWLKEATGSTQSGIIIFSVLMGIGSIVILCNNYRAALQKRA
ncbi:hypothetical protein IX83_00680 [Basilea psittacipulmonis DSM 24701]|uniref:Major facilitator superfamily (MFS) profile domain-containing protein n=1 Tax=Basilea psittacipulmonis DSM 24701 TaxID=1072685 RepID=A0A077DF22_9BURK|nr:hypothetical protein IX83_00680 [Basilea psittacipulmonis DSM 24701]